mmetsp:Transcript_12284/g.18024  ORF Transcript_12284/g.18024 Transcript_12284/m.18024 type:complete len:305 (+) Transcript_12284:1123-2037(+)
MLDPQRTTSNRIRFFVRILLTSHTQRQTVNDPHGRGQLPVFRLFCFQTFFRGLSNFTNRLTTQSRGFRVLRTITLAFETRLRRQLHVLDLVVNVLFPLRQPLNLGIVPDFSPRVSRHRTTGCGTVLGKIELDLFGNDSRFESAHFGMLPPAPEGPRWFHIKIPDAFQMTVDNGVTVLKQNTVVVLFSGLLFVVRDGFFNHFLFVQVTTNGTKVTFGIVLDDVFFAQEDSKVGKEVFRKDLGRFGIAQMHSVGVHSRHECGGFFLRRRQIDWFTIVQHLDAVWFVDWWKGYTRMFHGNPLTSFGW